MKIMSSPPLPFPGNKKNFRREFIDELKKRFDDTYTFVDLFGGSGFLSYLTKQIFPHARVIFNDYDDYAKRVENIPRTNDILEHVRELISNADKCEKLPDTIKQEIVKYLRDLEQNGEYLDFITLSSALCFSNKLCDTLKTMSQCYFYNKLKRQKITYPEEYLSGLEIFREDYKTLYDKFKDESNIVFFIDPPYLASEKRVYKTNFWRLPHYLKLLPMLKEQNNWFFFTNAQGYMEDLLKFIDSQVDKKNKTYLDGVDIYKRKSACSYNGEYEDLMFVKGNKNIKENHCQPATV